MPFDKLIPPFTITVQNGQIEHESIAENMDSKKTHFLLREHEAYNLWTRSRYKNPDFL